MPAAPPDPPMPLVGDGGDGGSGGARRRRYRRHPSTTQYHRHPRHHRSRTTPPTRRPHRPDHLPRIRRCRRCRTAIHRRHQLTYYQPQRPNRYRPTDDQTNPRRVKKSRHSSPAHSLTTRHSSPQRPYTSPVVYCARRHHAVSNWSDKRDNPFTTATPSRPRRSKRQPQNRQHHCPKADSGRPSRTPPSARPAPARLPIDLGVDHGAGPADWTPGPAFLARGALLRELSTPLLHLR